MELFFYGSVDRQGVYLIEQRFKWAESFVDGRAVVGDHGLYGPVWDIDHHGCQVFQRKFAAGSSFFKDLALESYERMGRGKPKISSST